MAFAPATPALSSMPSESICDRRIVVSLVRVRLAENDAQLRSDAMVREETGRSTASASAAGCSARARGRRRTGARSPPGSRDRLSGVGRPVKGSVFSKASASMRRKPLVLRVGLEGA